MARKIEIEIVGDTKGLSKAFDKAADDTNRLGSAFKTVGKAAAVGLAAVGAGAVLAGKKMVDMAGDAAEVDSKLGVVFGKELPALKKNLDTFADATGASSFKLREQAADMGALLGPLVGTKKGAADMSTQFVKLATDLGSFNNVPVEEALLAIRSGLVGEAEPLRRFGVLLNEAAVKQEALRMGLVTGNQELTEQQKVMARASLIMQQTSQAQGDATRTADSYANQMKALKNNVSDVATELGMKLLPAATSVVGGINDFIQRFSEANTASEKFGVVVETIGTLAKKAGDLIKQAWNAIDWGAVGQALANGARKAWDLITSIDYAGIAKNAAGKALDALKAAFNAINWNAVGEAVGDFVVKALNRLSSFINNVNWNNVGQAIIAGMGKAIEALARFLAGVDWVAVLSALAKGIVAALKVTTGILLGMATALGRAIVQGIEQGLGNLGNWIQGKLDALKGALSSAIGAVSGLAQTIGRAIVQGIIGGMESLVGSLVERAKSIALAPVNAAKGILGIGSPSKVFEGIGEDTIRGFILGITNQQPALEGKTKEAVQKALDAARARVEASQGRLGEAFGNLGEYVARQFEAKTTAEMEKVAAKFDRAIARITARAEAATPAEKELAQIDAQEEQRARDRATTEAEAQLVAAQAMEEGVEKERAIAAAKEAIRVAELGHRRAHLEEQAAIERQKAEEQAAIQIAKLEATKARELQNLEERKRQQGEKLDEQLQQLAERLAKHPEEYDKIQKKIQNLLAAHGIPMRKAGENLGKAFARGIRDSFDDVEKAVKKLAQIVADFVPHSPAKRGPLSEPPNWKGYLTDGFPRALSLAAGAAGAGGSAGTLRTAAPVGAGYAGGAVNINLHGPFYGDERGIRELTQKISVELNRRVARNG